MTCSASAAAPAIRWRVIAASAAFGGVEHAVKGADVGCEQMLGGLHATFFMGEKRGPSR